MSESRYRWTFKVFKIFHSHQLPSPHLLKIDLLKLIEVLVL